MNLLDLLIIIFAIFSIFRGYRIGLIRQAGSTAGFIVGLFIGSFIVNHFIKHVGDSLHRSILSLVVVLGASFMFMSIGEYFGHLLKVRVLARDSINIADATLGSIVGLGTFLLAIWLSASILVLSPQSNWQQLIKNSRIIAALNNSLPAPTLVISALNHVINPNAFPQVFAGLEPSPRKKVPLPSLGSFDKVVSAAEPSVVKVEGTGCGGIVEGSGFVLASNEIVTNAHVVAGVRHPKVLDNNGTTHDTKVVWFDPNVDLAVLQVSGLTGKPLAIDATDEPMSTQGVVLGFPGGGDFSAQPASVIDHFLANGRNIYGQGSTNRDIYSLQAKVIPGNSGGPVVGSDGRVLGIVFATSTTYNDVGYALTGYQVASELTQAEQSNAAQYTGSCSE